jgi:ubiquinone/menaquinone biosynthesis C-methylase UbiE
MARYGFNVFFLLGGKYSLEVNWMSQTLTERQQRERDYHRAHFEQMRAALLAKPFSYDVLVTPSRRWWNAYWQMFYHLTSIDLVGKKVLVVGCGTGDDALRIAKLGAEVFAFDLSPEAIELAKVLAAREALAVEFEEMTAEKLSYPDNFFDVIIARDILHHVDVAKAVAELDRVSKVGAVWVVNEIYSHSVTELIRRNRFTERVLYPLMQRFIYGHDKPYITEDERKLSEHDIAQIRKPLSKLEVSKHFNFLVTRIFPDRWLTAAKIDRVLLVALAPLAYLLAGRVLLVGKK